MLWSLHELLAFPPRRGPRRGRVAEPRVGRVFCGLPLLVLGECKKGASMACALRRLANDARKSPIGLNKHL